MVDIHCHILPEVDDGARSWEMASEMCRMAVADGVDHIVATPHANMNTTTTAKTWSSGWSGCATSPAANRS